MSLSMRLNKRVELYTTGPGRDAIGQPIDSPVLIDTVWAEVKDKDGDLVVEADRMHRTVKTNILIRYRELPDKLTVRYKGYQYRVDAVLGQDNRTLLLASVKVGVVPPP
jgi:SPP1 family predicted phage head-tail adaptor